MPPRVHCYRSRRKVWISPPLTVYCVCWSCRSPVASGSPWPLLYRAGIENTNQDSGNDMTRYRLGDKIPQIHESSYVAREATVIGDVRLAANTSVWAGAVLRGDHEPISVAEGSNIQEGAVLHTDPGSPLAIGERVTVG